MSKQEIPMLSIIYKNDSDLSPDMLVYKKMLKNIHFIGGQLLQELTKMIEVEKMSEIEALDKLTMIYPLLSVLDIFSEIYDITEGIKEYADHQSILNDIYEEPYDGEAIINKTLEWNNRLLELNSLYFDKCILKK